MIVGASVFMISPAHKVFIDQFIKCYSTQQPTDVFTLFLCMLLMTAVTSNSIQLSKHN